jgi:hypothetical protein
MSALGQLSSVLAGIGHHVSLDDVANDTTGRFSDAQHRRAHQLQNLETARQMVASIDAAMPHHNSGGWHHGDGDTVALSPAAQGFLNQINADPSTSSGGTDSAVLNPSVSFSNSLQIGGFSISVRADASSGAYATVINGPDGFHYLSKGWGSGGGWAGGGPAGPGTSLSGSQGGNVQTITISRNVASEADVTASSDAGMVSASVSSAESDSITFAIDFSTGTITASEASVIQNSASVSASAKQPVSIQA